MLIKKAKANYYEQLLTNQTDPRKLWKTINNAVGRKSFNENAIHKILNNQIELTNPTEIANTFNNRFFVEIGPNLASKIPDTDNFQNHDYNYPCFNFSTISETTVLKYLTSINEFKAEGSDGIPPKLVKDSAKFIAGPLSNIINRSIQNCVVPSMMKHAKVLPVYKNKGNRLLVNNYRPISILPIYSKIFEKILNSQMHNHLEAESIISNSQYGFQRNKGTHDALVKFANTAFTALNSSNIIFGLFIDFSKAFDTINHNILIKKLQALNFSVGSLNLLRHYLTHRTQSVSLNNIISSPYDITCGVPQGSILGPTLFLLYINDLTKHTTQFDTILFADDTNLFFESKNLNLDADIINSDLEIFNKWCHANKLTLNTEKTQYIIIKNPQNSFKFVKTITINDSTISSTDAIKFLGITIDSKLNWAKHIDNLRVKLRQSTSLIYIASTFLPTNVLILLYNSLINSQLVYCIEAWGNAPSIYLNKITTIQKRILRIIFHKHPKTHAAPLFAKANILPIKELYKHRICLLAFSELRQKNKSGLLPAYNLRNFDVTLPVPNFLTACGQRQVAYQASVTWNSLPAELRRVVDRQSFSSALKRHLLESLI